MARVQLPAEFTKAHTVTLDDGVEGFEKAVEGGGHDMAGILDQNPDLILLFCDAAADTAIYPLAIASPTLFFLNSESNVPI